MKAIVFGYHDMGVMGIEALLRHGLEIAVVFTHKDDPNENIWFRSVAELASAKNIPVHAPEDVNCPHWVKYVRDQQPDVAFSFYYRNLLKAELLAIPPLGSFNLHGSLLPKYRGRAPINWALINGETECGVTLHKMVIKPDAGAIVGQERIPIDQSDSAKTLMEKCVAAADTLLDKTLPLILTNTAPAIPQNDDHATYFRRRSPEDGRIDWCKKASEIRNLVRAVTRPYPGAFSNIGNKKVLIWSVSEIDHVSRCGGPGELLSTSPVIVATGKGAIRIDTAQLDDGVQINGSQLASELDLTTGMRFGDLAFAQIRSGRKKRVLILGVNGFIGSNLSEPLLASDRYEVHGIDLNSNNLDLLTDHPNFTFTEGDITKYRAWIEDLIRQSDVVVPLAAIATPIEYTRNALGVFELTFEENLKIVRCCAKYGKRIVFPSTSEVYGMCEDEAFDEDHSQLVLGPINKQRWIYASSKQLLDRVIWAYGDKAGLPFTLFRPFNWIGPRLDSLDSARIGSSRAITQLILNLVEGTPILLMDGGNQRRCFTYVSDGIECLYRILEDADGHTNGQIINIGNPENEISIRALAEALVEKFDAHPLRANFPPFAGFQTVDSTAYYGDAYQDIQRRRPNIRNALRLVGWLPQTGLIEAVERTLDFFLQNAVSQARRPPEWGPTDVSGDKNHAISIS